MFPRNISTSETAVHAKVAHFAFEGLQVALRSSRWGDLLGSEIRRSPVEVGGLSDHLQGFSLAPSQVVFQFQLFCVLVKYSVIEHFSDPKVSTNCQVQVGWMTIPDV